MAAVDGKYRLEIIPEVRDKVYYLAPEPELSPALIKTLALIAYKQPIYQSKIVEAIGNRAYEYIKELRKKEFIQVRKKGRTKLISTTGKFRKYFALDSGGEWKPQLSEEMEKKLEEALDEDKEQKKLDIGEKGELLEEAEEVEEELEEKEEEVEEEAEEEEVLEEEADNIIEPEEIPEAKNEAPREETV